MHINYVARVKKNNMARIGFVLLGIVVLAAILGPWLAPYPPGEHSKAVLQPPSGQHWLGTNDVGQDIFSRLVVGARTSLAVATGAALLTSLISVLVGSFAALAGGRADAVVTRITDALLAIPPVLVIILAAAYLRPGIPLLILVLALTGWPVGARVIRAQVLSLKQRTHVQAARTFGAGKLQVLCKHILPDLAPVIMVGLIQGARRAVVTEAGLAFLGIAAPGTVSWGLMIRHAMEFCYLDVWKWWLLPAGAALSLTVLAFTYIGFAVEEVADPRLGEEEHEVV